jgi:hypothetical protein
MPIANSKHAANSPFIAGNFDIPVSLSSWNFALHPAQESSAIGRGVIESKIGNVATTGGMRKMGYREIARRIRNLGPGGIRS